MSSARMQPMLGVFAGIVFVYFALAMASSGFGMVRLSVMETRLLLALGALAGLLFGLRSRWILTGRAKHLTVGILAGVIVGLLCGFAVSEICVAYTQAAIKRNRPDPFFGRMTAPDRGAYRITGLAFGAIAGATVGAGVGLQTGKEAGHS